MAEMVFNIVDHAHSSRQNKFLRHLATATGTSSDMIDLCGIHSVQTLLLHHVPFDSEWLLPDWPGRGAYCQTCVKRAAKLSGH